MFAPPDNRGVIELFAGPGGWAEGLRRAGFTGASIGLDNSRDACVTAVRAGHARLECDVATYPISMFSPGLFGVIASPPCQSFTTAGKQLGAQDRQRVMDLVDLYALGRDDSDMAWADERSRLTAQPMRWIARLRPDWIAMEQVPGVLPLWEHMAKRLADLGYFTWAGGVSAEEYGVPQTRRRSLLLAARGFQPGRPAPTRQAYRRDGDYSGSLLPAPMSMAEALGWDLDSDVVQRSNYAGSGALGRTAAERGRTMRQIGEPSVTITGKPPQWEVKFLGAGATSSVTAGVRARAADEPAHTITGAGSAAWAGMDGGHRARVSVREAGILQSFPADYPWHGDKKTEQYQQVGNAIPPQLAAAVLEQFVAARGTQQLSLSSVA